MLHPVELSDYFLHHQIYIGFTLFTGHEGPEGK
jgi:hypothetical protein